MNTTSLSGIILGIIGEGKRIANWKFQKHILLIPTDNFVPVHIAFAMVANTMSLKSVRITLTLLLITCFCKNELYCLYLEK